MLNFSLLKINNINLFMFSKIYTKTHILIIEFKKKFRCFQYVVFNVNKFFFPLVGNLYSAKIIRALIDRSTDEIKTKTRLGQLQQTAHQLLQVVKILINIIGINKN